MLNKILFVDDDTNILNAFQRHLRKQYQLVTANNGREGLEKLHSDGPFAVVVADMRMPEMDGVNFLKRVREQSPDTIRLMLTGNADMQTAIDAVNKGNVFRFLTKPCPIEDLTEALEAAMEQHRLVDAERELLQVTLNGAVKLLIEILAIAAPDISGQDSAITKMASEIARTLQIRDTWKMEIATMISHIAYITLPPETLAKVQKGEGFSSEERLLIAHLPETGFKLLSHIKRLEEVARIVLYQSKNFDGTGVPDDGVAGDDIPIESRILKVLLDLRDLQKRHNWSVKQVLAFMHLHSEMYDSRVVQTAAWYMSAGEEEVAMTAPSSVNVNQLRAGQILASNVETKDGRTVLITAGKELTATVVEKLINFHQIHRIREPIQVCYALRNDKSDA